MLACDSRELQGAQAGPSASPARDCDTSVIASLSCQSPVRHPCPNLKPTQTGNSNLKSNNKMQSVNVTFSTNLNLHKGNDNCLLVVDECNTAVTVPNTKPQRNIDINNGYLSSAANNNSSKLDVVNVYDKNNGALIRLMMEPSSQCRLNQIPGFDIPVCDHQILDLNKSEYLKQADEVTYNDNMTVTETEYIGLERLIALSKRTKELISKGLVPRGTLGLYGGGESSLSTGTTGWGTPPSTNSNNNNGNYNLTFLMFDDRHFLTYTCFLNVKIKSKFKCSYISVIIKI